MRLEESLARRRVVTIGLLTGVVSVVKAGFANFNAPIYELDSWPTPLDVYPPLTYGYRLLAWISRVETEQAYLVIAWFAVAVVIWSLSFIVSRRLAPEGGRFVALILLGGPIIWVLSGGVSRTDPLLVLGGLIVGALGASLPWALVGAVIATLGNPEQAVALLLGLLLVSIAEPFRSLRREAALALVASASMLLLLVS